MSGHILLSGALDSTENKVELKLSKVSSFSFEKPSQRLKYSMKHSDCEICFWSVFGEMSGSISNDGTSGSDWPFKNVIFAWKIRHEVLEQWKEKHDDDTKNILHTTLIRI